MVAKVDDLPASPESDAHVVLCMVEETGDLYGHYMGLWFSRQEMFTKFGIQISGSFTAV